MLLLLMNYMHGKLVEMLEIPQHTQWNTPHKRLVGVVIIIILLLIMNNMYGKLIYVHIVGYLELATLSIRGEMPFALHKL